jgi:hypothetical protein
VIARVVLRLLAAVSLAAVVVAGLLLAPWVLPVETVREVSGTKTVQGDDEELYIVMGPGVSVRVESSGERKGPVEYRATTRALVQSPVLEYNENVAALSARCSWPLARFDRCGIDLEVTVPDRLLVVVTREPEAGRLWIDQEVNATEESRAEAEG